MSAFKPLKAVDVKDLDNLPYPLLASIKYDGVYGLVRDGKLLGRSLKSMKNKFITEMLSQDLFEGFCGELAFTPDGFNSLNDEGLCRSTTSCVNTIEKEWPWTWMLFDYTSPDIIPLGYRERLEALREYLEVTGIADSCPIQVINVIEVQNAEEVMSLYQHSLAQGYEGLILRAPEGRWKNGRSTLKEALLLRMKPQDDAEAVITSVNEAMQNNNEKKTNELGYSERSSHKANLVGKGMVGSFEAIDIESGLPITIGAGKMKHKDRLHYFENPPIGELAKYRSMTYGVKDAPRFGRFYDFRSLEDLDDALYDKAVELIKRIQEASKEVG